MLCCCRKGNPLLQFIASIIMYKTFINSSALLGTVCAPAGILCPILDTTRKVWSYQRKEEDNKNYQAS